MTRGRLNVYAIASLPPGIPLKHPVLVAATSIEDAAKILRVSRYHLTHNQMREIAIRDIERAMLHPRVRIVAGIEERGDA